MQNKAGGALTLFTLPASGSKPVDRGHLGYHVVIATSLRVHIQPKHKLRVKPELRFKYLFFRPHLQSMKPAEAAATTSLNKSL